MVHLCGRLEEARGLKPGRLRFEVQVETPQLVLGADGATEVARCVQAGGRRLTGLHYGTYDYSAALQIAAGYQSMDHPAARLCAGRHAGGGGGHRVVSGAEVSGAEVSGAEVSGAEPAGQLLSRKDDGT